MKLKKCNDILFWFFAIIPFFIADFGLRYGLTNMAMYPVLYNVIPVLFDIFWIGLIVYVCWGFLPKNVGSKVYILLSLVLGVWFFANYVCFNMCTRYTFTTL